MVFNKQKFLIALICTSLGWVVGFQMGKAAERKSMRQKNQNIFNLNPFSLNSPFGVFDESEHEDEDPSWWRHFFPSTKEFQGKIFNNGMSLFGGGDTGDFKTREDDQFVYYEYEMEHVSKDSLNIRVENGMVVIEGSESKEAFGAQVMTSFHRAFPVPANVDAEKVQMDYVDKKLIIKFPKITQ